jgi:hypothetical protein
VKNDDDGEINIERFLRFGVDGAEWVWHIHINETEKTNDLQELFFHGGN